MEQKEAAERRKTERAKVYIPPEEDKPVKKGPVEGDYSRTCLIQHLYKPAFS